MVATARAPHTRSQCSLLANLTAAAVLLTCAVNVYINGLYAKSMGPKFKDWPNIWDITDLFKSLEYNTLIELHAALVVDITEALHSEATTSSALVAPSQQTQAPSLVWMGRLVTSPPRVAAAPSHCLALTLLRFLAPNPA